MVRELAGKLTEETKKVFIGKDEQILLLEAAVFCGGHVLLNDLPGSGKTTLAKAFSRALGCSFRRIQFTPDLLPSDIIGMTVFDQKKGEFKKIKGPVFTNILLADEINRALPRTQSALLEAMEEGQVTIDGDSYALPKPFIVIATQNPVEEESTFRLPAAQRDRFFMTLSLGFPDIDEEAFMLERQGDGTDLTKVSAAGSPEELALAGKEINEIYVSGHMRNYIVSLISQTRQEEAFSLGASPRASKSLYQGSKAIAAMSGRSYVVPEDIQRIFTAVVSHRVIPRRKSFVEAKGVEQILQDILDKTPVPPDAKESLK